MARKRGAGPPARACSGRSRMGAGEGSTRSLPPRRDTNARSRPRLPPERSALRLLLRGALRHRFRVGRRRRTNELFEGSLLDLLAFTKVDRSAHVAFQAGVEKLLRIGKGSSAK